MRKRGTFPEATPEGVFNEVLASARARGQEARALLFTEQGHQARSRPTRVTAKRTGKPPGELHRASRRRGHRQVHPGRGQGGYAVAKLQKLHPFLSVSRMPTRRRAKLVQAQA